MAVKGGTGTYGGKVGWSVGLQSWLDDPSSKVARYWRSIEYGSNNWPSGRLSGLWGNVAGPNSRPGSFRNGELSAFSTGGNQKFVPFFNKRGDDMGKAAVSALIYYFGMTRSGGVKSATNLSAITETRGWDDADHKRKAKDKNGRFTGKMESRGSGPAEQRRSLFMLIQSASAGKKVPFVTGDFSTAIEARHFYTKAVQSFDPVEAEVKELREVIGKLIGGRDPYSRSGFQFAREEIAYRMDTKPRTGPRGGKNRVTNRTIAGRLGGNAGIVSVSASATAQDFLRSGTGFSHWQAEIEQVNARVAKRFQQVVVDLMRAQPTVRRPTGDLIAATDDPRNRYPR